MSKKTVLVTGATGQQGGSLVRTLLEHGDYRVRALSRNVDSDAAKALAAKGVEVVSGDLINKDSLMSACKGAYAVFGVTIPEFFCGVSEVVQGRNLVDACKTNNVDLLVWSSLPSCKDTSEGRYAVPPFDEKAEVEKYIHAVGQPAIIFRTGGFSSNLLVRNQLVPDKEDGTKYHVLSPCVSASSPQPWTYIEKDLGPVVYAAIRKWEDPKWRAELTKQPIPLVSYQISGDGMAAVIAKETGKKVDCHTIFPEGMPQFYNDFGQWCEERLWGYGDEIPVVIIQQLGVKTHTFQDYVRDAVVPWFQSQMGS